MSKVNIAEKFSKIHDYYRPHIAAELNGQQVKLVKNNSAFVFHHHDHEDEMFLVVKGRFRMEFRDRHEWIEAGEFIVVPAASSTVPWPKKNAGLSFSSPPPLSIPETSKTNVPCAISNVFDVSCPNVETQFITNANHCLLRPWCPTAARPSASSTAAISLYRDQHRDHSGAVDEIVKHTGKRAIPQFVIDGEWVQPYVPGEGFLYEEMARRLGVAP